MVTPRRLISTWILGPAGKDVLRRAMCHQISDVEIWGRGNLPGNFASFVSKGRVIQTMRCLGSVLFQICTARLDSFGTHVQLVQIGVTALIFN